METDDRYKSGPLGSSAWAVYSTEDVDAERPLVPVYGEQAARDLAAAMNGAAERP